jgi:hypothetical protein
MKNLVSLGLLLLGIGPIATVHGQEADWDYEDTYDELLINLHELVNYAYDLEWQFDWERRLLADNGVRVNVGSVKSKELLTRAELRLNQPLNEKWRLQGRFLRNQSIQRSPTPDQFFLGLERDIFESSALFLMVDPQMDKEFIDVYGGYTFYQDDREQYVRAGLLFEDVAYDTKNESGGTSEQAPVAVQWVLRLGRGDWWVFSEGKVGTGFEREFDDTASEVIRHERRDNHARLKLTKANIPQSAWSVWLDWYDFTEAEQFRSVEFDYDYENEVWDIALEHFRILGDVHRLRFLVHYVRQRASSVGFNAHDYSRDELLGGFFYERLWPRNGVQLAYAFGFPEIDYEPVDDAGSYHLDDYNDKLILGWRHHFSADAQLLISISHEVSAQGFGGGNVQFQMSF